MIYRDNTDPVIERRKAALGLSGDVYIYNDHFIEDMDGHRRLIPESTAATIEEAYAERAEWEQNKTVTLSDAMEMLSQLGVDVTDPEPSGDENDEEA